MGGGGQVTNTRRELHEQLYRWLHMPHDSRVLFIGGKFGTGADFADKLLQEPSKSICVEPKPNLAATLHQNQQKLNASCVALDKLLSRPAQGNKATCPLCASLCNNTKLYLTFSDLQPSNRAVSSKCVLYDYIVYYSGLGFSVPEIPCERGYPFACFFGEVLSSAFWRIKIQSNDNAQESSLKGVPLSRE